MFYVYYGIVAIADQLKINVHLVLFGTLINTIWISKCFNWTTTLSYSQTLSHNSIYSIHSSYYSFVIGLCLGLGVLTIYLVINAVDADVVGVILHSVPFLLLWSLIFA